MTLYQEAAAALGAGNLLVPLRAYVAAIMRAGGAASRRRLYVELDALLRGVDFAVTAHERSSGLSELGALTCPERLRAMHSAVEGRIARLRDTGEPAAGSVNVLLAATQSLGGTVYGSVQRMRVSDEGYGSQHVPLHAASRDPAIRAELERAFEEATQAAFRHIAPAVGGGLHTWSLLRSTALFGRFDPLPYPISGESLGVAAAVGVFSTLTGIPIDGHKAFTGRVAGDGVVAFVRSIQPKLDAAYDKGIHEVYLPADNLADVDDDRGMNVIPISHIAGVLDHLFGERGSQELTEGLDNFRRRKLVFIPPTLAVPAVAREEKTRRRALLTFAAMSDPWVRPRADALPEGVEFGPLVTAAQEWKPDEVHIVYVESRRPEEWPIADRIARIQAVLSDRLPRVEVFVGAAATDDPTNLEALMANANEKFVGPLTSDIDIAVNITLRHAGNDGSTRSSGRTIPSMARRVAAGATRIRGRHRLSRVTRDDSSSPLRRSMI